MSNFEVIHVETGGFIKVWNKGVPFEPALMEQIKNIARMPFVRPYAASMPDAHFGKGSAVGSVVPTVGAICPAMVGVDIGCGMMAVRCYEEGDIFTSCPSDLADIRKNIERVVPHGRTNNGRDGDRGAWHNVPEDIHNIWENEFSEQVVELQITHPKAYNPNAERHLGTLGTGNHFIEVCKDELDRIWVVLHSGSRGFGNKIGSYFTSVAKDLCAKYFVTLPDPDLAYLPQGTEMYSEYIEYLHLAQRYALRNREIMMGRVLDVLGATALETIQCHHNYMSEEKHFGQKVILTRKGAVDASLDKMVIIPGSMGDHTYIARGLGNPDSFHSCSHGAGRAMGRRAAEKAITPEQHMASLAGIECHNGPETIDESPAAYKSIDAVMAAQSDLVEPVHILKQVINIKGWEK